VIIAGSGSMHLATKIANELDIELCKSKIEIFADGEIKPMLRENIRGCDVFIIQSTNPPAENLLELLLIIDAAKRSSAKRITAVMPYIGYTRQDRKDKPRVPISAKLIANLITTAGADRMLGMDFHFDQLQGFFDIPVDHLYGSYVFVDYFKAKKIPNLVVVAPDIGSVRLARAYAKRLDTDLVIIDKRRLAPNEAEVMNIIGDVNSKNVLFVDDMIDTAITLTNSARAISDAGADKIYAACSHALLSKNATTLIMDAPINELVVTDSIENNEIKAFLKVEVLSIAQLFANAIDCIHNEKSISILFEN
jgi:ribose-phosphate pyrophosphokinase